MELGKYIIDKIFEILFGKQNNRLNELEHVEKCLILRLDALEARCGNIETDIDVLRR